MQTCILKNALQLIHAWPDRPPGTVSSPIDTSSVQIHARRKIFFKLYEYELLFPVLTPKSFHAGGKTPQ